MGRFIVNRMLSMMRESTTVSETKTWVESGDGEEWTVKKNNAKPVFRLFFSIQNGKYLNRTNVIETLQDIFNLLFNQLKHGHDNNSHSGLQQRFENLLASRVGLVKIRVSYFLHHFFQSPRGLWTASSTPKSFAY